MTQITITLPSGNIVVGEVDYTPAQGPQGPRGLRGARGTSYGPVIVSASVTRDEDGRIDTVGALLSDESQIFTEVLRDEDGLLLGLAVLDTIDP